MLTEYILTDHAEIRCQQRGLSKFIVDLILEFGNCSPAPGGATKVSLGKREHQRLSSELKKTLQTLDKAKGGNLILSDQTVITAYKNS